MTTLHRCLLVSLLRVHPGALGKGLTQGRGGGRAGRVSGLRKLGDSSNWTERVQVLLHQ